MKGSFHTFCFQFTIKSKKLSHFSASTSERPSLIETGSFIILTGVFQLLPRYQHHLLYLTCQNYLLIMLSVNQDAKIGSTHDINAISVQSDKFFYIYLAEDLLANFRFGNLSDMYLKIPLSLKIKENIFEKLAHQFSEKLCRQASC